jgi:hypothetical protein
MQRLNEIMLNLVQDKFDNRIEIERDDEIVELPRFVVQVLGYFPVCLSLSCEPVRRLLPSEVWVTLSSFYPAVSSLPAYVKRSPNLGQLMLAHGLRGVAVENDICGLFRYSHNWQVCVPANHSWQYGGVDNPKVIDASDSQLRINNSFIVFTHAASTDGVINRFCALTYPFLKGCLTRKRVAVQLAFDMLLQRRLLSDFAHTLDPALHANKV